VGGERGYSTVEREMGGFVDVAVYARCTVLYVCVCVCVCV
jgi:hypothetical protein